MAGPATLTVARVSGWRASTALVSMMAGVTSAHFFDRIYKAHKKTHRTSTGRADRSCRTAARIESIL